MYQPQVPPKLDYLKKLIESGDEIIDVSLLGKLPELNQITVYLKDGRTVDYFIRTDAITIMEHFREAVAFSGFGPRGLANLIHADVMQRCRNENLKSEQFDVHVSQECFERIKDHAKPYTYYGYQIFVDPSLKGLTYTLRQKDARGSQTGRAT